MPSALAIPHASAAVTDDRSIVFRMATSDGETLTGSVTPSGSAAIYEHHCSVQGGRSVGLFATQQSVCPHALAVGPVLVKLAKKLHWPPDAVGAMGEVTALAGENLALGTAQEWLYQGGKWVRGAEILRPRPISFTPDPSLDPSLYGEADEDYVVSETLFTRLDASVMSGEYEAVLVVGPSGCGKSKGAMEWAHRRGRARWAVTLGVDARVEDVVGGVGLVNGSTMRREGLVSLLAKPGVTLIFNELTAVNQREWTPLWPFLEKGQRIVHTVVDGERYAVAVHPTARIIATANESKSMHAEANGGQGFAQLRRFSVIRLGLTADEVLAIARKIVHRRLSAKTLDLGAAGTIELADLTPAESYLDFEGFGFLVRHLLGDPEATDVIEVSPEIVACAMIDAANPEIGLNDALVSHFVLKATTSFGQDVVAAQIVASGAFAGVTELN